MSPAPPSTGYALSRWLFLRLLGIVYLVAFGSLAVQVTGLIGSHGLLPAGAYLDWAHSIYGGDAYRLLPTVFWLSAGDTALRLAAWGGVALAILLVIGVAPMAVLAALWALYLSLTVAGQDFLSFQWDALLLEAGLLAVLWAPPGWLPRGAAAAPSAAVRWLLVFLLFKLMFLSGATKLLSGDPTWRHLTALDYHFETQPLPTWVGWYAHQLPSSSRRTATAVMFAIELGAPWLLFAPPRLRKLRYLGVASLLALQAAIALTGNYGFFNLLAMVLCVPVLDDDVLRRLLPRGVGQAAPAGRAWRTAVHALAPVLLCLSALSFWAEIAYTLPGGGGQARMPRWAVGALAAVAPLRSFNGYGLFRVMTTERPELVVEGSRDGTHWREYEFRWKPGSLARRPGFVEPDHPRLDWQMWFAALDPMSSLPLLRALSGSLRAGSPDVLALLGRNPFPGDPPRFIRFAQYDYRFTTPAERSRTGDWWRRDLVGYLPRLE
jgi:lipase maturation factor 1